MGNSGIEMDSVYYGRVAYEAYREQGGWVDAAGKELLDWELLGEDEQQRFVAAGTASVRAFLGEQ